MIEIPVLISIGSLFVAAVVGFSSLKRDASSSDKKMAGEMTTLIVKLENIGDGVNEIKSDLRHIKNDVQELRDRVIIVEQSTKSAHRRIDDLMDKLELKAQ